MERTLAAFSAIVLLIGCFTGCGMSDEPKKIRIPDITFMYTNSFEDTYAMWFCDSAGNYYTAVSDDVKAMGLDRLREEYAAGTLGSSDIRLVKNCDKTALEKAYTKLVKASGAEGRELEYPEALPALEAPEERWYGLYYDKDGRLRTVTVHANTCMTEVSTGNEDLNEVYEWFSDTF